MRNIIFDKIGFRVAATVNLFLLLTVIFGTYILVSKQTRHLEEELLTKGENLSVLGAQMLGTILQESIDSSVFSIEDAFDTDYQPIGNYDPPKYHTKYDSYLDKAILTLQDKFLADSNIVYAVASDRNGYVPTHNSRYQRPLTGDPVKDRIGNRTKRIYNEPIGLKASQNIVPKYLQTYHRDTGEVIWDISSPIYVKGKHWGGFRVGISLTAITAAKKELTQTVITIMATVLLVSIVLTFFIVNRSLAPIGNLSDTAKRLANGEHINDEITTTTRDEIGELQNAMETLRVSMLIALKRRKRPKPQKETDAAPKERKEESIQAYNSLAT